ncbi:hypothetical protein CZP2022_101 [Vibrio phage C-ZP2022]|nr:hypothetical protein CZP2022_101 [Vibrio phage C-ZP2022]
METHLKTAAFRGFYKSTDLPKEITALFYALSEKGKPEIKEAIGPAYLVANGYETTCLSTLEKLVGDMENIDVRKFEGAWRVSIDIPTSEMPFGEFDFSVDRFISIISKYRREDGIPLAVTYLRNRNRLRRKLLFTELLVESSSLSFEAMDDKTASDLVPVDFVAHDIAELFGESAAAFYALNKR